MRKFSRRDLSPTVHADPNSPDCVSDTMSFLNESVGMREANSAAGFINRFVGPNSVATLSTVNMILEEVEETLATRQKLEVTALLSFFDWFLGLLHWWITRAWDVDAKMVASWALDSTGSGDQ